MRRVYTFDTADNCSSCGVFQWYWFRKQPTQPRVVTFDLLGVVVCVERRPDWIEFILDDSLQLTTFKCPKKDKYGIDLVLSLGETAQVFGYNKFPKETTVLNASKLIVHTDPNAEVKYWIEQIQTYKEKVCHSSRWSGQGKDTENTKHTSSLCFSPQVSWAALTCWKLWNKHFSQGGYFSLSQLWEVLEKENDHRNVSGCTSYTRNQILRLLTHLGYLFHIPEKPGTYLLLTDDILDKQVLQIFNHNLTSGALSLRQVANELEKYFHVEEIRLERIEESVLRLAYQEKVEQV